MKDKDMNNAEKLAATAAITSNEQAKG
jgi:hypothetical protein